MQFTLNTNAVVGIMLSFGVITIVTPIGRIRFTDEDVSPVFGLPRYGNRPGSNGKPTRATGARADVQNNYGQDKSAGSPQDGNNHYSRDQNQDNYSVDKDNSYRNSGQHRDHYGMGTNKDVHPNYGEGNSGRGPASGNNDYRQQQNQDYSMDKDKSYQDGGHYLSSGFRKEYHRVEYGHRTKYFDSYGKSDVKSVYNNGNPSQYNKEQDNYGSGGNFQNRHPIVDEYSNANTKYETNREESDTRY